MKQFPVYILCTVLLFLVWNPATAQAIDPITDVQVTHTYGYRLNFSALLIKPDNIKDIFLFFEVDGENETHGSMLVANPEGNLNFSYDVKQNPIPPFANISYWFTIAMQNGDTINSQKYLYQYTDNRFSWQTLKSESVEVYWYSGDKDIGKIAFDTIHQSILRLSNLISIAIDDPIILYLYATNDDLPKNFSPGGQSIANPEKQVIMISIEPGVDQITQMEQKIPYELTNLLLYRKTGITNILLPVWLKEGIATQIENPPYSEYDFALANAIEEQNLISIMDLCTSFPQEPVSNMLAFAEARSFTTYLYNKYGKNGVEKLIRAYTITGSDCEQGTNLAFGRTLSQLEFDWLQATFNKNAPWQTIINFLPYLFILFLILLIPLMVKPIKSSPDKGRN